MKVYVAIFNPQGSMGGFEWRATRAEVETFVREYEENWPRAEGKHDILGIVEVEVSDEHTSNDDITSEVDAQLQDLERELGYVSPHDTTTLERDEVIVLPSGTEISVEAAVGDLHRAADLIVDDMDMDMQGAASDLLHAAELIELLAGRVR